MNQDTLINNQLITGKYKFNANRFATNYGDSLSINNTSLYLYRSDLEVKRVDASEFSFIGIRMYQVSEFTNDTLIVEGWLSGNLKYNAIINDNSAWSTYLFYWFNIDKIVFRAKLDYNIDNILLEN